MKYRNKPCQACGEEDKSKRKVCLKCKKKFPFSASAQGLPPFNRRDKIMASK